MLVEVRIPVRHHAGSAYEKVERKAGDWAVAAAGAALAFTDAGRIEAAGIGLAAVGADAVHARAAEELLRGREPAEELFAEAGRRAGRDCEPVTDGRGTAEYKRHLAAELTTRALRRAAARAAAGVEAGAGV
jgi:carbon-monoxide dehydrogenase medium subunit